MTEEELASYQAQWEQIDDITARRLREARGMSLPLHLFNQLSE